MPTIFAAKPKSSHKLLHSFCFYPSLRFETQADDEKVVLVLRAHPITQIGWVITSLIIFFLPFFFNVFLTTYLSNRQIIFINLFWYLFLFSFVFLNIVSYLFNVGIVTNKRIIDVDFQQILYKEVTASSIANIEDVTVKSAGFIASFFNYGDLFIQTAGEEQNIEFLKIPNPTQAASVVNQLMKSGRWYGF